MTIKELDRINELAKKKKTVGLTPEEEAEQQALRKAYIETFRASLRSQLDHTTVVNPDGTSYKLGHKEK